MDSDLTDICWECGKRITADEAVVNWLSCSECLDANVRDYQRKYWLKDLWFKLTAWFRKNPL